MDINNFISQSLEHFDGNMENILNCDTGDNNFLNKSVTRTDIIEINDVVDDEPINIDDFMPADEEDNIVFIGLLNIFTCYFKQLYVKKQNETMFDNIDAEKVDSTNKLTETLYDEMFKYNQSLDETKDILYDPDDNELDINAVEELYALYIDNESKYVCKYLLPLLQYLSTQNWANIQWWIIPIKSNQS